MRQRSLIVPVTIGLTVALYAAASFTRDARLWGVNALAFYPVAIRFLALAMVLLGFVPRIRDAVAQRAAIGARALGERPGLAAALAATIAFALFLAVPAGTLLWGDGHYVAGFVRDAARSDAAGFARYLRHTHTAFTGADFIFTLAGRLVSQAFHVDAVAAVRVLAALSGALLVLAGTRRLLQSKPPVTAIDWFFAALATTSGAIMLFFGYVEVYAPFFAAAVLYLATAWRALNGGSLWKPVACALVATVLHLLGVILLPSLAFLIVWVARERRASPRFFTAARVCAILLLPLPWLFRAVPQLHPLIRPLVGTDNAVLSSMHAVDVANELLLVVPTVAVLAAVTILARMQSRSERGASGKRAAHAPHESAFVSLLVVPAFLFLIAFRSDIGMARDWDLFAPAATVTLFLFWSVLRRTPPGVMAPLIGGGLAVSLVILSTTVTAAWIGVNVSSSRSVARYQTVMTRGVIDPGYAYEQLAIYHRDRGDTRGEIAALESAVGVSANPRYRSWLALRYFYVGEREKALVEMRRSLHTRPEDTAARQYFVHMLHYTNHPDELISVCEEGARLHPEDPFYPFFAGKTLVTMGFPDRALSELQRAKQLNPPPEMAVEIDKSIASINATR